MPTHIIAKGLLTSPAIITRGYLPSSSYGTALFITTTRSGERNAAFTNGGELSPGALGGGAYHNTTESGGEA